MSIYDDLRSLIALNNITKEYSDEELDLFISEAKLLINAEVMEDTVYTDFKPNFKGRTYVTNNYPLKTTENISITIDDKEITPTHINKNGIIYFDGEKRGELKCEYVVGLNEEAVEKYSIPIILYLIKETNGGNITSVGEGDVHINYSTITDENIVNLIDELKNRYSARIRLG